MRTPKSKTLLPLPTSSLNLLEKAERKVCREALETAKGCRKEAAKILGIPRQVLNDKMNAYGLHQEFPIAATPPKPVKPPREKLVPTCSHGHPMTPENTRVPELGGNKQCIKCFEVRQLKRAERESIRRLRESMRRNAAKVAA